MGKEKSPDNFVVSVYMEIGDIMGKKLIFTVDVIQKTMYDK